MRRRVLLALTGASLLLGRRAAADDLVTRLRDGGLVLLMRHARTEPGTGDPPGFRHDDCSTQRNLDAAGRAQARAIGERLRAERVPIGRVLTSRWCRCRETAELLGVGPVERFAPLDSFFEDRARRDEQRAGMLGFIRSWDGPGNAVLVTHQVNMTAVAGVFPRSGEIVVLTAGAEPRLLGRLPPPAATERGT
jgi:phosphohistidine phosphatase SixA